MGSLAIVLVWVLIRVVLSDESGRSALTSLNLMDSRLNLESENSSVEDTASTDVVHSEDVNSFVETYYANRPASRDVAKFIRIFLTTGCYNAPDGSVELTVYFLARIARDRTDLIRLYENELSETNGKGTEVLLEILRQAGDGRTKEFLESCLADDRYFATHASIAKALERPFPEFQSVLLRPVRSALDLDLLWAEFLATGSKEPVFRIIDVLNRPDLVHERIQEWLNTPGNRLSRWRAFRGFRKLPESFELRFDRARRRVLSREDLDCRLGLDGVQTNAKRSERIRSLLPVQLSAEDLYYIAVKSMAKWSLASNAAKHPIVLEACKEAEAKTVGARLSLLEAQAEAYLLKWQPGEAEEALAEYLRVNPDSKIMARKRTDATAGIVSIPHGGPNTVPLLNRPGTCAAAFLGVFLLAFGDTSFATISGVLELSFWLATISASICLLLAIGFGALRQIYNGLLERAVVIPTDRGPVYLGTVPPPFWFSVRFRAASWLLVGALSVWASWVLAGGVLRSSSQDEFLAWSGAIMLARFGISLAFSRGFFAYRRSHR